MRKLGLKKDHYSLVTYCTQITPFFIFVSHKSYAGALAELQFNLEKYLKKAMAPNPRVRKAFHAMKVIGIPEEKVKPVLKDLLKLYDRNWELIEEENYRALADAILERDEMEVIPASILSCSLILYVSLKS